MKKGFRSFAVAACAALAAACIFPAASAFAHPGDAKAAFEADTMEAMRDFVTHARDDADEALVKRGIHGITLFWKQLQKAPWKYDDTYVMAMEEVHYSAIIHPKNNRRLFGRSLQNFPTVRKLRDMAKAVRGPDGHGPAVCTQYEHYQGGMRWACAIPYRSPGTVLDLDLIAGFDHAENDPRIIPVQCPDHAVPSTTAADVEKNPNKETLEKFVKEAARIVVAGFRDPKVKLAILGCFVVDETLQNINDKNGDPTGKGSIYVYVMTSGTAVFINGNNPNLRGDTFRDVFDEDGVDVSAEILKAAPGIGQGGFIEYKWDDPAVKGDEVDEDGKAAGTSPKVAYVYGIKVSDVLSNLPEDTYAIVGSGYYPKQDVKPAPAKESDTGCAIAGAGFENSAFGIFLAVFSICFVLCMRSRRRT